MTQIRLDHLVAALASSVAEAEHSVRLNQIRNLRSFFDDRNEPVSVDMQLPKLDPRTGETVHEPLKVPLLTLVTLSNMSISEMEVKFQTHLGDVSEPKPAIPDGPQSFGVEEDPGEAARKGLGWSERDSVAIGASTGPSTSESGTASVVLRVKQAETPEGLSRLVARLNRML